MRKDTSRKKKKVSYLATKLGQRGQNHRVWVSLLVINIKAVSQRIPQWCQEHLCLLCL